MISIYQIKNWFMFPKSPGMIVNRNKTGIVKLVFLFIWISIPALSYSDNNEAGERPNLLIIITDQQRFDALSYAGNTILKTPNMDRIAKEGVWFRNAHTQCAVCTPARASMFTGRTVENTLVIFMSDHGEMMGAHGMRSKNVFYEESSHIPLMMRFPGRIEPGTKVDSYISLVNVFATIFDYLEMPPQASDGFSLRGLIEGTDEKNGKYVVTEWLSSLTSKPSHMVLKDGWKLMIPDSSATEVIKSLYNLNDDPYEMNNLLGNNPDAYKYEAKVAELEYCFVEWLMKSRGIALVAPGISRPGNENEISVFPNSASEMINIRISATPDTSHSRIAHSGWQDTITREDR